MPDFTEIIKLALRPRYSLAIWVTGLLLLAIPLPGLLQLDDFRKDNGKYLGIITLLAFIIWLIEAVIFFGQHLFRISQGWNTQRSVLGQLDSLTDPEQYLLARAVSKGVQTINWQSDSPEVASLIEKGLLCETTYKSASYVKPYTIPRPVWDHIRRRRIRFVERTVERLPDKAESLRSVQ